MTGITDMCDCKQGMILKSDMREHAGCVRRIEMMMKDILYR
jgi:hypothetical protein